MSSPKSWLLERRLTLRMIAMQFVTLVLFFGVGVFPFTIYPILAGIGDIRPLDPRVTTVFAKSLAQGADGTLVVRHELRGLKRAAGQAEHIDVGPVGRRLSEEDLPAEVHSLVRAINDALARLDETYIRRERFLADSAHELRTPIAILQTRLETAEPFPERAKLLVDVARLSSLAGQLLDLQRLDLEGSALETIDLVELASRVVGDLAPLAIVGGYELSLNAPSDPVLVAADPTSLGRAFTNIIQNAIAYGGNRGTIEVEVTKNGTIEIGDDGPGIPAVDRERIFEPFYRAKPLSQGAGLGLNLVESIVRRHHGHIAAVESPSGGARFVITLPLAGQRKGAAA